MQETKNTLIYYLNLLRGMPAFNKVVITLLGAESGKQPCNFYQDFSQKTVFYLQPYFY